MCDKQAIDKCACQGADGIEVACPEDGRHAPHDDIADDASTHGGKHSQNNACRNAVSGNKGLVCSCDGEQGHAYDVEEGNGFLKALDKA